ncbi:DNA methyltransferase, partial [Minwuia thermotolerans]|uniref:DNA methyltransferase n=1 Tax=Minwuia thermotolerans TaxID=2056226 RepID=UPI0013DDD916
DIVLDGFGGSGTTLIAAEQVGRKARLLEFDPAYCDTIVRRWERITGKHATLAATGERFEDVEEERLAEMEPGPAEELGSGDNHAETGEEERLAEMGQADPDPDGDPSDVGEAEEALAQAAVAERETSR